MLTLILPDCPGPATVFPYLSSALRRSDKQAYRAAGVLAFRVAGGGGVQILLARHMPDKSRSCNDVRQRASTWNLLGGKREDGEDDPLVTASRETEEESALLLPREMIHKALKSNTTTVMWIPRAAYAVYIAEVCRTPQDCTWNSLCKLRAREQIGAHDIDQAT